MGRLFICRFSLPSVVINNSQTLLIPTRRESKQVSVLTGVDIKQVEFRENVRAFIPQGQSKLSIIMMCRYEAGVCKAGFDCT